VSCTQLKLGVNEEKTLERTLGTAPSVGILTKPRQAEGLRQTTQTEYTTFV
jgi:hypothetical protein